MAPIYPTLTDDEVAFIVNHSDSKFLFVENAAQLKKALFAAEKSNALKKIILFNDEGIEKNNPLIMKFSDLLEIGAREYHNCHDLFEKTAEDVGPDDLATIVYTSGTTGRPKGAMITHKNIMAVITALDAMEPKFGFETDQTVPFLPLSHVFERIAGHFFGMYAGITASYAESLDTILADIQEKRPTEILAVPRVLEKVYQKIIGQVQQQSSLKQSVFYWGQRIGAEISTLREQKKMSPLMLMLKMKYADVFTPDGYLMSGDIGTFDGMGFLTITDRKKDLIITSGGKNVAPQNIENLFKNDPLFSQFIVIGEKRKYLTALVNINPDQAALITAERNIPFASFADLYDNAAFLDVVKEHLHERNSLLARYETIKKIAILKHDFSQQTGELTATLKVKRRAVQEMHAKLIDSLYDDAQTKTIIV